MKGLTIEQMEFLAAKGLSMEDAIAFAKMGGTKSKAAERTARWRARKAGNVTGDVTRDASPPPMNTSTPPVSSDEETTAPARKLKKVAVAKPEGVSDQTWDDWSAMRDRQKAPISTTAINGIKSEAVKAGWTLEAALARAVMRNWRGFEAEWVKNDPRPGANEPADFLAHYSAKQAR